MKTYSTTRCARPKLQNNLKANHNRKAGALRREAAVRDLSYRIIWKQITTLYRWLPVIPRCARPKLQNNLKANHNQWLHRRVQIIAVRDLSYRIIWKQITTSFSTRAWNFCAVRDLSYRIIWKQITTHFTHNDGNQFAVRDLSYRIIWKQITTFYGSTWRKSVLCET